MSVIVLLLGILAAGAGLAAIGFAIPVNGTDLGRTLIIAGTTGLTGGLILLGLAAAVRQLTLIAEGLRARPQSRPVRPSEASLPRPDALQPRPEPLPARAEPVAQVPETAPFVPRATPEPRLPSAPADVSSSAIERLRSNLPRPDRVVPEAEDVPLSPNVNPHYQSTEPAPEPSPPAMRPSPGEGEPARQPRLDFLFRSRAAPAAPAVPTEPTNPFESMWPKRSTRQREARPPIDDAANPAPAPTAAEPAPAEERRITLEPISEPIAAPAADETPSVAILKSGVVDGMAYTLYADGSIEAQLPQGTVRFASITELRAHIETNS